MNKCAYLKVYTDVFSFEVWDHKMQI